MPEQEAFFGIIVIKMCINSILLILGISGIIMRIKARKLEVAKHILGISGIIMRIKARKMEIAKHIWLKNHKQLFTWIWKNP